MSLCYGDTTSSLVSRKNFLEDLGINYIHLVCAKQVHGNSIKYVTENDLGRGALDYATSFADTDGFITDIRFMPLAIFTADCLSIFLYDPKEKAVGLVHAGWRSTQGKIAQVAVRLMQEKFRTRPEDLLVGFGPCLRECCYEVGEEFLEYFPQGLIKKGSQFFLDLAGINRKQLTDLGVKSGEITDPGICTSCQNNNYFSFRKEKESCGRMMSVVMLKNV